MNEMTRTLEKRHKPVEINFRFYAGREDAAHMAAVTQRCLDASGVDWIMRAEDFLRRIEHLDNFKPAEDILLVENAGHPIAYAMTYWNLERQGDLILRHIVDILPEWRGFGVEGALLAWAEEHLLQKEVGTVQGDRYLSTKAVTTEVERIADLEAAGYEPARYFYEMLRSLKEPIPELPIPEGLRLKPAVPADYRQILAAADEAFQDHWGYVPRSESMIQETMQRPEFQPDLWQVAWDQDEVAGMVLNYIRHDENRRYNRKRGFTEDICVRTSWRRRGLASALIATSLKMLKGLGVDEASLGVDTDNPTGALQLYERLGFIRIRTMMNYRKTVR